MGLNLDEVGALARTRFKAEGHDGNESLGVGDFDPAQSPLPAGDEG